MSRTPTATQRETVEGLLAGSSRAPCACGRLGMHMVCPECAAHADAIEDDHGEDDPRRVCSCNADFPAKLRPFSASPLSPWDIEFLTSCLVRLTGKRARELSPKQAPIVERIAARLAAPSVKKTTADRDALDLSPKRGRTWRAMVKACRFSLVTFHQASECGHGGTAFGAVYTQAGDYSPARAPLHFYAEDETACPVCGLTRARVERVDMLENPSREIVAAVRADIRAQIENDTGWDKLPDAAAYSDAMRVLPEKSALAKVLAQLLDWHRYAVNVGILTIAA